MFGPLLRVILLPVPRQGGPWGVRGDGGGVATRRSRWERWTPSWAWQVQVKTPGNLSKPCAGSEETSYKWRRSPIVLLAKCCKRHPSILYLNWINWIMICFLILRACSWWYLSRIFCQSNKNWRPCICTLLTPEHLSFPCLSSIGWCHPWPKFLWKGCSRCLESHLNERATPTDLIKQRTNKHFL